MWQELVKTEEFEGGYSGGVGGAWGRKEKKNIAVILKPQKILTKVEKFWLSHLLLRYLSKQSLLIMWAIIPEGLSNTGSGRHKWNSYFR